MNQTHLLVYIPPLVAAYFAIRKPVGVPVACLEAGVHRITPNEAIVLRQKAKEGFNESGQLVRELDVLARSLRVSLAPLSVEA